MHIPHMLSTTSWITYPHLHQNLEIQDLGIFGGRHENPYKDPSPYHFAGDQGKEDWEKQKPRFKILSQNWHKHLLYVVLSQVSFRFHGVSIQPTIHHENITSAVEECHVPSKGCAEKQTKLCPNRIGTSKHQTMCHNLSDLWHCGCRFNRFCHCLLCTQLPCFCS